ELTEGVAQAALLEGVAHEPLERREREEARGQVALGLGEHVGDGAPPALHRVLADGPEESPEPAGRVAERVRGVDGAPAEVQRVVEVLVDDAEDLGSGHAVGEQRADDGARAAADVHLEVAAAAEPLLERCDGAYLVHATDDPAARQRERVPGLTAGAPEAHRALQQIPHGKRHCSKPPATASLPGNPDIALGFPLVLKTQGGPGSFAVKDRSGHWPG